MANEFNLPEYEKLVTCPYNKAHQVVQHRLGRHIIKCARSHGGAGFKECTFNWTHVFPVSEIAEHEANCPERAVIENFMTAVQNCPQRSVDPKFACISSATNTPLGEEENWDNLPPVPTYNPRKANSKNDVMFDIKHGTPSQRKTRRENEHQRLTEIRGKPGSSSM